jgi:putative SOS response-associated peptidase YedK
MRWGLVPFFTKQLSDVKGISTINARAETVEKSPSFRTPFKKRRCLVPADGFYEWKKLDPKTKQPFAFRMGDGAPFAFAGTMGRMERRKRNLAAVLQHYHHGCE